MQDVTKSYDSSAHWLYQTEMEPGDCCVFRFIGLIEIVQYTIHKGSPYFCLIFS